MATKTYIDVSKQALKRLQDIVELVKQYVIEDIKDYAEFEELTTPEKRNWIKNEINRIESHVTYNIMKEGK